MEFTLLDSSLLIIIFVVAFLFFIVIAKFGLKQQLNWEKVWLVGFIVGFLFGFILVVISSVYNPNSEYLQLLMSGGFFMILGMAIAEGIVSSLIFIVLYVVGKKFFKKVGARLSFFRNERLAR